MKRTDLTSIEPAFLQGGDDLVGGALEHAVEITLVARLADAHDVVKIVRPQAVEVPAVLVPWIEHGARVAIVLGENEAAACVNDVRRLREQVHIGRIVDRMGRIHAKAIDAKLVEPVAHIVQQHGADGRGIVAVQVEILAPRVVLALKEKEVGVLVAVIPLGPQVIEHGVEDHRQSALMAGVDEGAKFVRRAVAVVRRKEQHAIVTPSAPAGPIRHGMNSSAVTPSSTM